MQLEPLSGLNKRSFYQKNKKRIWRSVFLMLLIAVCAGGMIASKMLKTKGYSGLWDFASTVTSNYINGMDANPENLSIEIKDKDFKKLEKNRRKALERGVIINDLDGDYVPATVTYKGKKYDVKLRLKGHMTDHLQENKWSFRIKVKDKETLMGMKRFSVQHPGTRGYIYEWIYHQMMKQEDVIALRYRFMNVSVNGKDWGIYAIEENFEKELIENNNRKPGPVIRFNPDLYWVDRYNELERSQPVAEFASYYSAAVEAYREDKVLEDSLQRKYYLNAIALMEGFRSRKLSVEQVFDIPRLAKFHAVIDLVGGQHSIDWSDIKYYYNPVTAKLEPVAYESFTVFPFQEIAGNYRYFQLDSTQQFPDLHTALFSSEAFFREYIKQLERISLTAYLDDFFSASNDALQKNLAIIYKEFPYKKFDKQSYYRNQDMIRQLLSAPKALHAYYNGVSGKQIHLQLGAIESLPTEVISVSVGAHVCDPASKIILPAKQHSQYVNYKEYAFNLPDGITWNDSLIALLKVNYSVLGATMKQEASVFPFPHTDSEFIAEEVKNKTGNAEQFPFLLVDALRKEIIVRSGKQEINTDLVIPAGYKFIANAGVTLNLKNHAKIISYSPLIFTGDEDQPIVIESGDSSSAGIEIINAGASVFNYVVFKNFPKVKDAQWKRSGAIVLYESPVTFNYCRFYNFKAEDCISVIRSGFSFKECLFQKMQDALDIDFSEGTIINCVFEQCSENALDITMGKVSVKSVYIDGAGKALNVKGGTQLKGNDVKIKNAAVGVNAEGRSAVELKLVMLTNVKTDYLKKKKSSITVNGAAVGADNTEENAKAGKEN